MSATHYIVATIKPWNVALYNERIGGTEEAWTLVSDPAALSADLVRQLSPRYIFFPHWSWRVPQDILESVECVCFHMTDLPYGRGGTPLQNLIVVGHEQTMLTALRMTDEIDAGPIYMKRPLSLEGRAEDIYRRAAVLAFDMIAEIAAMEPGPTPQQGDPTLFARRTPDMSALPADATPRALYDHIRMLDAETYPPAFVDHGAYRLEFRNARLDGDKVEAHVTIQRKSG